MPMIATLLLTLILAIVTALFALQNTAPATVRFLVWEYQTSLVLVILSSAALGVMLAYLVSISVRWRMARESRVLNATVKKLETRIWELEGQQTPSHSSPQSPQP